ncbi:MAG TPA: hypothetical protein VGO61_08095 [Steroidobacteraceae bacterium]|jgi:hypothetical protein|nr:hypothetical protein [Steroidobacteraceae bacterium]
MTAAANAPRSLIAQWLLLLLAPAAWAAALGVLFSLTDEVCTQRSPTAMLAAGTICLVLAAIPLPLSRQLRRRLEAASNADRARFMLDVACGASAIFVLVTFVTLLPILWLSPCRT